MIEVPYPISRRYIVSHRNIIFIYSNDYWNKGCLGMSWEMANEPNSFPVPTCFKLCPSSSEKFFRDESFERYSLLIDERIASIPLDGRPIIVAPKIGMGHSQMIHLAPQLHKYMWSQLNKIRTEVKWKL